MGAEGQGGEALLLELVEVDRRAGGLGVGQGTVGAAEHRVGGEGEEGIGRQRVVPRRVQLEDVVGEGVGHQQLVDRVVDVEPGERRGERHEHGGLVAAGALRETFDGETDFAYGFHLLVPWEPPPKPPWWKFW